MGLTLAFILFVAYATFVTTAASCSQYSHRRLHRVLTAIASVAVILVLPAILVGANGLPSGWDYHWLGRVAAIGQCGLWLMGAATAVWLASNTVIVWRDGRRLFPFAFRRPPER